MIVKDSVWKRVVKRAKRAGLAWQIGPWPDFDRERKEHFADETEDLVHELGHHLVAPPRRRRIPSFGLGHPSGGSYPGHVRVVSRSRADMEEGRASLLGVGILYESGDHMGASQMLEDHNWLNLRRSMSQHVRHRVIRMELKKSTITWMLAVARRAAL